MRLRTSIKNTGRSSNNSRNNQVSTFRHFFRVGSAEPFHGVPQHMAFQDWFSRKAREAVDQLMGVAPRPDRVVTATRSPGAKTSFLSSQSLLPPRPTQQVLKSRLRAAFMVTQQLCGRSKIATGSVCETSARLSDTSSVLQRFV